MEGLYDMKCHRNNEISLSCPYHCGEFSIKMRFKFCPTCGKKINTTKIYNEILSRPEEDDYF